MLKIRVKGPEAQAFFEFISTNCWPKFQPNQGKHAIFCRDDGSVVGEGVLLMLAKDDFIFTSVPGVTWAVFQFRHGRKKFNATLELVSDDWFLYQVQGPNSIKLMEEVAGETTRDIPFMGAKKLSIDGRSFLCLRGGIAGEPGFELWGPASDGQEIWKAFLRHGQKFGIRQLGSRAKSTNHVGHAMAIFGRSPCIKLTGGVGRSRISHARARFHLSVSW